MKQRDRDKIHRDIDLILDNSKPFNSVATSVAVVIKKSAVYIKKRLRHTAKQTKS